MLQRAIFGKAGSLPYSSFVAAQSAARTFASGAQVQAEALRLWTTLANVDESAAPTLPQRFDGLLTEPLGRTISRYALDDDLVQAYLALPLGEATSEALIAFPDGYFSGLERDDLAALAKALTSEEMEGLFDIIHGESPAVTRDMAQYLTLPYYVCNENIPFNSPEGSEASRDRYVFSQLADTCETPIKSVLGACEGYPDTWAEASDFHAPVTNDVPTLVFVGNNDTQTAVSGGELVRDAPLTAVSTACVADLRPQSAVPVE